jgi:hypothetical protein
MTIYDIYGKFFPKKTKQTNKAKEKTTHTYIIKVFC